MDRVRVIAPVLPALVALLLAPPPAAAVASAWHENDESAVRLLTPYEVAPREGEIRLGLHFTLAPGWHVYWKNSGDAGFPPVIDAGPTPELRRVELLYPAPERFALPGDLEALGYAGEVVYPVRAVLAGVEGGAVGLAVELDYLVCEVDCIPYRYTLRADQPVAGGGAGPRPDPDIAPLLERWSARLPRPADALEGVSTEAVLDLTERDRPALEVGLSGVGAAAGERPAVFLEAHDLFDVGGAAAAELERTPDGLRFVVPLEPLERLTDPPPAVAFAWTVTGLRPAGPGPEGDGPLAVEARRTVPVRLDPAAGGAGGGPEGRMGLVPALLLALGGGVLLALTPTSLALLLAVLLGWRTGERTHGGAAFGGAVAGGVALALLSLAAGGAAWDEAVREPALAAALAVVCLACALWLWGLLGSPEGGVQRTGPRGSATAGALAPLLALPWPIPPLPAATEAVTGGTPGGGALPPVAAGALLGVGMGIPWLLGAALAARPGAAGSGSPERLREGLGFLAVLTVPWLLFLLSGALRTEYLAFVELSLLVVALAAWGRRRMSSRPARALLAVLLLAAAAGTVWLADRGRLRARGPEPVEPLRADVTAARAEPSEPGAWDNPGPGRSAGS